MFNGSKQVRERLDALETESRKLRNELDELKRHTSLDWEELLDKVHRWMQRTGARERAEERAAARTAAPELPGLQAHTPQGIGTDPVSAELHRRRARLGGLRAVQGEGSEG